MISLILSSLVTLLTAGTLLAAGELGLKDFLDVISQAGSMGLLVLFIMGGMRRWWIWGWQYIALEKERNEWRELALKGTSLAEKVTEVQESKVFRNGS